MSVTERAERRGTLKIIGGLFDENSALGSDFCKDYSDYLNKVMDSDDFTFDEKGIGKLREKVRASAEKKVDKKKIHIVDPVAMELERFDTLIVPDLKRVFKLVQDNAIGKDTARIFLDPVAMAHGIVRKDFESDLYVTMTSRSKYQDSDAESDRQYRVEVRELVKELHGHTEGIKIQDEEDTIISYKGTLRSVEVMKRDGFVYFGEKKKKGDRQSSPDIRCYVTVKEDKQKEMVARLREHMNEHKEFRGAFDFKVLSTSNGHKLDNIVIYLNSKKNDPKLFKEFIDGYAEKIKDIASDEESMSTVCNIKKGIGISTEPSDVYRHIYRLSTTFDADIPDSLKKGLQPYPYDRRLLNAPLDDEAEKGKARMSWNEYCSRLLVLSAYIARRRLGRTEKDGSVSGDEKVKQEMDKVFREFMALSGIDPAMMMLRSNEKYMKVLTGGK
ncbi:MAG: hypothetical protein K6E90_06945 [Lachnospiraceae bacterium]|nr:hypothetical protein [Lachnospiraceae bacterium]